MKYQRLAYVARDIGDVFQEKKKVVIAVIIDLSKAFGQVKKEGLLFKLLKMGVEGKMYRRICNFLHHCRARNKQVAFESIWEGVPQGGFLYPILFLVCINDVSSNIEKYTSNTLHADDVNK